MKTFWYKETQPCPAVSVAPLVMLTSQELMISMTTLSCPQTLTTMDHPPWSKVVQGGPAWSRVVQSESSRVGPSLRADSAAHSARQAAGSNRGELSGTQRGMRRRSQRVSERRGASPGWRALDHAGPPPTWSKVVQCGPCGPGSAVCEGGSPSSRSDVQTTRKAISRRLAEFGPVRQGISIDLLRVLRGLTTREPGRRPARGW